MNIRTNAYAWSYILFLFDNLILKSAKIKFKNRYVFKSRYNFDKNLIFHLLLEIEITFSRERSHKLIKKIPEFFNSPIKYLIDRY